MGWADRPVDNGDGGSFDVVPKLGGFAPKAEDIPVPNVEGPDGVVPKLDCGCPKAVVEMLLLKAEGALLSPDWGFEPSVLDPSVNADAGMVPNGEDPNDEGGLARLDAPPNADCELPNAPIPLVPPNVLVCPPPNVAVADPLTVEISDPSFPDG